MRLRLLLCALLCWPLAATVTLDWDDDEINVLDWNGTDFSQNVNTGTPFCCWVTYADAQAYTAFDSSPSSKTENVDGWSHTYRPGTNYELGVDVVISQPCADCVAMEITVTNDGTQQIEQFSALPLELKNPSGNTSNCNGVDRVAGGAYNPALEIKGTWGKWVLWHDDLDGWWSIVAPCGGDATTDFDVNLRSYSPLIMDDGFSTIGVGQSKTITLHMKFAAEGDARPDVATSAYEAWRAKYPIAYKNADARPWMSWFMASEASVDANGTGSDNPRGYIHFSDWTNEAAVYTAMMAKVEDIITRANSWSPKPQGVILWDIEGNEFEHTFTYVGDPTAVCPAGTPDDTSGIAPEMCYDNGTGELLIDAIMRRFKEAGLRTGLTLRPQPVIMYGTTLPSTCVTSGSWAPGFPAIDLTDVFVKIDNDQTPRGNRGYRCNDTGDGWVQYPIWFQRHLTTRADVVAELKRKIGYAYERWGVTAYYVDTNNWNGTYWHGIFYEVAQTFPDVTLFPEWEDAPYIACCKPYDELDLGISGVEAAELELHPAGSIFLNIQDGDRDSAAANIRVAMRRGSPVLIRGWFGSPSEQSFAQTQYTQAITQENGVVTFSTGERFETTIPIVERVQGSCYPHEAVVRCAADAETLEACNPLLGQGCGATTTCRSTESPCTMTCDAKRLEAHSSLQLACSVGAVQ